LTLLVVSFLATIVAYPRVLLSPPFQKTILSEQVQQQPQFQDSFDRFRADRKSQQLLPSHDHSDRHRHRQQQQSSFDYGLLEGSDSVSGCTYAAGDHRHTSGKVSGAPSEDPIFYAERSSNGFVHNENASPNMKPSLGLLKAERGIAHFRQKQSPLDDSVLGDDDSVVIVEEQSTYQIQGNYYDRSVSKYFGGGTREVARRVTLESPETKSAVDIQPAGAASLENEPFTVPDPAAGLLQQQDPTEFSLYDDFLGSPKPSSRAELLDDEIEESPECSEGPKRRGLSIFQSRAFAAPKPKSTIGPSKTMRFRFGP